MIRRWCPRISFLASSLLGFIFVVGIAASTLLARQGILVTNDGRTLEGDIQEAANGQSINVTVHGATATLDRNNVNSISYSDDAAGDFQKRLKGLDADDVKGRLDLSRMELSAKQYDLATEAAKDAERVDPHNPDAAILLDTIKSERNLQFHPVSAAATTEPAANPEPAAPSSTPTTNPAPSKYLTLNDVYAIRGAELQPDDDVRVDFYSNVRQRYVSAQKDAAAGFDSLTPAQQTLAILDAGDPKLTKDVRIATDPHVLNEFRTRVLPRVLTGCLNCHNSSNSGGGFVLYPDSRDPTVWYTDFYILQKSSFKVHTTDMFGSGPVERQMIDRIRPEDSLLLQFGLPRSVATVPHPDVKGYKPIFHGLSDPAYLDVAKWIMSLKALAPDYGIKYEIPTGPGPTTQP